MTTKYQTRNGAFDAEIVYTDEDARPNLNTVVKLTDRKTGRVVLLLAYEGGRYNMDADNGLDLILVPTLKIGKTYFCNFGPNPYEIVAKRGDYFVGVRDSTVPYTPPVLDLFEADGTKCNVPNHKLEITE